MHVVDYVIDAGWAVFWIYWLVSAAGAKPGQGRRTGFAAVRVPAVLLVLVLLRLGVLRGHADTAPWLPYAGLALFLLGLALAVWARVYLGRNWGMPMTEKSDPELVRTGPYRVIRHPIYSGILLAMAGTALAVNLYWLAAVVLLGAYFVYSAVVEERTMTRLFPDVYPDYRRSTAMLVPFIL